MRLTFVLIILSLASFFKSKAQVDQAEQYFQYADQFFLEAEYDSALLYIEKANSLFEQEEKWEMLVGSLNKTSEVYLELFQTSQARQTAQKAMDIIEKHLVSGHLAKSQVLHNLGNSYYVQGQHDEALTYYDKALDITDASQQDRKKSYLYTAPSNMGIGDVYFGRIEYDRALGYFENLLKRNKEILGDDHTNVANFYCIVGNLHKNRGSDRLAKEMYEQALDIYSKEFNQDHPSVADTYVGFADIYKNQGDFSKAEEYYNRAIDIYASYFDQTMNPRYGPAWLGRADIHKNKGSYQKAIDLYNKALDLSLKTVGEIHQHTATAYLGLANTYMYQEKFKEALKYYNKVLDVNFNLVGAEHESTAAAYNNLGSLYYFAGDFDLAENYLLRALRTDIAIHGSKHPNVANAYYNLARIQGEIGNTRRALEYTQSAINASISDFNKSITFINPVIVNFFSNRDLLTYLSYKGKMLKARVSQSRNMKGLDLAIRGFLQSDSLVDEVRKSYSERHDEVELATLTENIYESAVHGCYKTLQALNKENVREIGQNVSYNEKKSEYENSFFHFIEKKKVVTLFSSVAKANAKSYGAVPDSLLKKDKELKKRISRYSEELSYVTNALRIVELQDSLFKVNRQYEKFIAKIEKEFPRYYELKYDLGILSLADLQSFIDSKTAVLSYLLTKEKLYTAKITQNNFQIISASLDPNLDRKIRSFRNAVLDADKKSYLELGYALYKQFFPTELTKDIEKVIVIPDGKMAAIPFEALLSKKAPDTTSWHNMPYLLKDYAFSYSYSASLLYDTFKDKKTVRPKAPKELFLIAPVTFNAPYLNILKQVKNAKPEQAVSENHMQDIGLTSGDSKTLTYSEQEAKNIYKAFAEKGKAAKIALRREATENRLKNSNLNTFKYVHIASHSFVNQEQPEFSGILLNRDPDSKENGILFSGEIYALSMNAELVSLSACETGLGKIKNGEGIMGIARALTYAGAKNLSVSLWKVNEQSTAQLMTHFYRILSNLNHPESRFDSIDFAPHLREAKLKLLDDPDLASPLYWSPFILIGM